MATQNPIVTGLTAYVEEHKSELLTKSMLEGKSRQMMNLMTDVKSNTTLNLMDTDVVFQGLGCGWNESGTTEFSQRVLVPVGLEVNMAFCDKNLLKTWAQYEVKVAAGMETLPFEEKWVNSLVDSVNEKLEKMIYQGQSGQTTEFEGLISILDGDANTVKVSASSADTAYEFLKGVAKAIPVQVKNPVILVSTPLYREYMQDLVAANLYHYDPANGENEYRLPATDIKVIAVEGLIGADNYVIAADLNNLFYGVSADGDEDTFDLFYSKDNREFRFVLEFIAGVQVAFPDEIVLGKRG